jgi:hypothetical protein
MLETQGINFDETFAPIVKWVNIWTLVTFATLRRWMIKHFDVETAFLNGKFNEKVFMVQLKRFVEKGKENKMCLLLKALSRLKQGPRAWYSFLDTFLQSHGLKRSATDHNFYFFFIIDHYTFFIVYIDDLLLIGDDEN